MTMWKKILKLLDLDSSEKHAELYLISRGGTLFKPEEALKWANENLKGTFPNIAHGHGGPALRVLIIYRKRRELKAVIKAIKAKYDAPLHLVK